MSEYADWARKIVDRMLAAPPPATPTPAPTPPPEPPSDHERIVAVYQAAQTLEAERMRHAPSWMRPAVVSPVEPRRMR